MPRWQGAQSWDNTQERKDAQKLPWKEFHERWPDRSQYACQTFRRDLKRGKRKPEGIAADSPIPPGVEWAPPITQDEECIPLKGKRGPSKLTLAFGDTQFGDEGHLYECWQECCAESVALAKRVQPAEIEMMCVGDLASGRGIYRNQELRNILPLAQPHVLWGCWEIAAWIGELRKACPKARIVGKNVIGNHDLAMGENLALMVPFVMQILGQEWKFCGRQALINAAAEGPGGAPYMLQAEHGYGHSSYYANSYQQIRGVKDDLLSKDRQLPGEQLIHRVVCGHTHWLNIGYHLARGRFLDTVGGFQRQERLSLPPSGRPVGFIAYVHDGQTLTVRAIRPRDETVDRLENDQALDLRNGLVAYQQLFKLRDVLHEKGLVA